MYQNYKEQNLQAIADYFASGCKSDQQMKYGLEVEHFAVRISDQTSIHYEGTDGMENLLHKLHTAIGGDAIFHDSHILGIQTPDYSITIEPASQLEISTRSSASLAELESIYRSFRAKVDPILLTQGLKLVSYGYHPVSCVRDLPLIPKKRYEYMDAYFRSSGTRGINMMRGTASTQISIDYFSEEDFVQKFRLASILSPVIKLLTDNTPYFEGRPVDRPLLRSWIWEDVDTARTGLIPHLADTEFGFRAYAEYLWSVPLILRMEGSEAICTGKQTVGEIYGDTPLTKADIEHIISMVFPDVRLKKFIEIRMADGMSESGVMAYTAFIKGLFGSPDTVRALTDRFPSDEALIRKSEVSLMIQGYRGSIFNIPAAEFAKEMTDLAAAHLTQEEAAYLGPFYTCIREQKTMTQMILDAANQQ